MILCMRRLVSFEMVFVSISVGLAAGFEVLLASFSLAVLVDLSSESEPDPTSSRDLM